MILKLEFYLHERLKLAKKEITKKYLKKQKLYSRHNSIKKKKNYHIQNTIILSELLLSVIITQKGESGDPPGIHL